MFKYDNLMHVDFSGAQKYCATYINNKGEEKQFHQDKREESRFPNRCYIPDNMLDEATIANMVRYMTGLIPINRFRSVGLQWDKLSMTTAKASSVKIFDMTRETKTRTVGKGESWNKGANEFFNLDGVMRKATCGRITSSRLKVYFSDVDGLWEKFCAISEKYDPSNFRIGNIHSVIESLNAKKNNKDVVAFLDAVNDGEKKPIYNIINGIIDDAGCVKAANGLIQKYTNIRVVKYAYRGVNTVISLSGEIVMPITAETYEQILKNFSGSGTVLEGGFYYISGFEPYRDNYMDEGNAPYPYNFK